MNQQHAAQESGLFSIRPSHRGLLPITAVVEAETLERNPPAGARGAARAPVPWEP
ncbi:hypothetical protein GCM10022227_12690 [Streptomyces sedi]